MERKAFEEYMKTISLRAQWDDKSGINYTAFRKGKK